jgi:hypothetical protein
MLALLALWPQTMDEMGPRWVERVCTGERDVSGEKERMAGRAQTWIMASGEPERKKLEVGSTASAVTGWRCEVDVDTRRPEHICTAVSLLQGVGRGMCTNLPGQHAATLGAQQQHRVFGRQRNAVDALGERDNGLLVALVAAIHVHDGLVRLRRKDMRAAHRKPVLRRGALLEDMALRGQRLVLVQKNARVLGHACVRFGLRGNRRDELLGEHVGGDGGACGVQSSQPGDNFLESKTPLVTYSDRAEAVGWGGCSTPVRSHSHRSVPVSVRILSMQPTSACALCSFSPC